MGSSALVVLGIVILAATLNICFAQVRFSVYSSFQWQWLNRPIFNSEQLTFTPNWGKRSNSPLFGGFNTNGGNGGSGATNNAGIATSSTTTNFNGNGCKTSLDSLMMIYRLIQASFSILPFSSSMIFVFSIFHISDNRQTEAQKYDECTQK